MSYLSKTDHVTSCPWKGDASYYSINLDSMSCFLITLCPPEITVANGRKRLMTGETETELKNAAWTYETPKDAAKNIKGYVAFCEFPERGLVMSMYIYI